MDSRKESEKTTGKKTHEQEGKRLEMLDKILNEILVSERMFLKKPNQIKNILIRKFIQTMREQGMEKIFPEERNFISHLATTISIRDEKVFAKICDRLRNRLVGLGGFTERLIKLIEDVSNTLKIFPELGKTLRGVKRDLRVVRKEAALTEKRINNTGNTRQQNKTKKTTTKNG